MEPQKREIACYLISSRAPSVHIKARDVTQTETYPTGRVARSATLRSRQARKSSIIDLDTDLFQLTNFVSKLSLARSLVVRTTRLNLEDPLVSTSVEFDF